MARGRASGRERKNGREIEKDGGRREGREGEGRKYISLSWHKTPRGIFVDPFLQTKNRLWELKEITEGQNPSKQRFDPNSKDSESCAFSRQPR